MKNNLEKTAEKEVSQLWCEAQPVARRFVTEILRLDGIPEDEECKLVKDATRIGDALYQTTVFDYDREADGLRLSPLLPYSDQTIKRVTQLVRELGAGNKKERGLGESTIINAYLSEFKSLLEACGRTNAIAA